MVSDPTSTNTIEITIATIGRLMKNFDITSPLLRLRGERFRFHHNSCTDFLYTLGYHCLAAVESLGDNPFAVDAIADFNGSNTNFVFGVDDRDLICALKFGNGALRYQQSIVFDANDCSHFPVAARPQNVAGVRKQTGYPD